MRKILEAASRLQVLSASLRIAGSLLQNTIDQGTGYVAGSWSNRSHALALLVLLFAFRLKPLLSAICFFYRRRHIPTIRIPNNPHLHRKD